MGRLIEVQGSQQLSGVFAVNVGDLIRLSAMGARVHSESSVVDVLGSFVPAVVGVNGQVIEPAGTPNTVILRALRPGTARVTLLKIEPWHGNAQTVLEISVSA